MDDELDALLDFGNLLGQRGLAQLDARAGFVDKVDGLVGQEAVGDIAVGVRDGELDSGIRVADRVELLVAVLDAVDDLDGVGSLVFATSAVWWISRIGVSPDYVGDPPHSRSGEDQ